MQEEGDEKTMTLVINGENLRMHRFSGREVSLLYRHCSKDSMVKRLMNMFLYFGLLSRIRSPVFTDGGTNRCSSPQECNLIS